MNNMIKTLLGAGFAIAVAFYVNSAFGNVANSSFLMMAALFGAYMAMNIGANDVANNVGPAVGAGALSIGGAIVIASIFEAAGALLAGGDVVGTIKKGIIDPVAFAGDPILFIYAMAAALLAAALWLTLATMLKAPVSTTHSIVGGVMGAGIAAAGFDIVNWTTMSKIVASWVISPMLGGVIAALFLFAIKKTILFKDDKIKSAKEYVPIFVALMSWAFMTYLTLKGLKKIWPQIVDILNFIPFVSIEMTKKPTFLTALILGFLVALVVFVIIKNKISKHTTLENTKDSVNKLFTIPLIFSAALLSFAHGANDVANAIGPLAAIADAVVNGGVSAKASIPLWVMSVGALGISLGLALYGPKLIKTVGSEITELDQTRAFSIAMAASITVIIASQLGLPVSSTHIAIGGVFGVGFLREYLHKKSDLSPKITTKNLKDKLNKYKKDLKKLESQQDKGEVEYKSIVELYQLISKEESRVVEIKRDLKKANKIEYVKRDTVKKIIAAWIITVPAAAVLASVIFFTIKGIMI